MIIRTIILTKVLFTLRFVEFKNKMEPDLMIGQILSKRINKKSALPLQRVWVESLDQNLESELRGRIVVSKVSAEIQRQLI